MLSIDLAGSQERNSGYAYFERGKIKCGILKRDEEILRLADRLNVKIVGIDAPLSWPKHGKLRQCELLLKKMKIRFFPVKYGGMKKLTQRGTRLAKTLQRCGFDVIELFPGGSYDLLGLKRKDVNGVNAFLSGFDSKAKNVDEADAAIGLFSLWLYKHGLGLMLKGNDGSILLAKPSVYLGKLINGRFIKRINRFVLEAKIGGVRRKVYLRNTGKLADYFYRRNEIYVSEYAGKYRYILRAVNDPYGGKVMADPFLDVHIVKGWLRMSGIIARQRKVKFGDFVFDLSWKDGICEVKGANMHWKNDKGIAIFPDVYSKRAEKQIKKLSEMKKKTRMIVFVSHFPAKGVALNPEFEHLVELFRCALKKGLSVKALSTIIVDNYWIFEKETPFLWLRQ